MTRPLNYNSAVYRARWLKVIDAEVATLRHSADALEKLSILIADEPFHDITHRTTLDQIMDMLK